MDSFHAAALAVFLLGLQTAIAPCPLTENLAAIAFLARRVDRPKQVLLAALLYTLGQALAYTALALLLLQAAFAREEVALFLERGLRQLLGPLLILIGMVLLGLLSLPWGWSGGSSGESGEKWRQRLARLGLAGPAVLGIIFALSFCPTTAAYFFGALLAACLRHHDGVILPLLYALGATLPVNGCACLLAWAAHKAGRVFNALVPVERWARRISGIVFIAAGLYESLVQVFGIL